jgi:hypothetical protein
MLDIALGQMLLFSQLAQFLSDFHPSRQKRGGLSLFGRPCSRKFE